MKSKQFTLKMNEDAIAELDRLHNESGNSNKGVTLADIILKSAQSAEETENIEDLPKETPKNTSVQGAIQTENEKLSETVRLLSEQVQALSAKNTAISEPNETALEVTDKTQENEAENQSFSAELSEIAESFKSLAEEHPEQAEEFQKFAETFQNLYSGFVPYFCGQCKYVLKNAPKKTGRTGKCI